jgi:hypothetical protein
VRHVQKRRPARTRRADEIDDLPTESASDTTDAAGLVEVINQVLED